MGVIKDILYEYSEKIDLIYWKDISESGIITQQILREITNCQYGICYLSEKTSEDGSSYKDDENVLIEAGILSANSRDSSFENWIPIREGKSPKICF